MTGIRLLGSGGLAADKTTSALLKTGPVDKVEHCGGGDIAEKGDFRSMRAGAVAPDGVNIIPFS